MRIRRFRPGDEMALHAVFHSAIHGVASRDYTPEQIDAWAPETFDREKWLQRIQEIDPFVVENDGRIVAYADLQADGYIDHFYVAASCARQGCGTLLMNHILETANALGIKMLTSNVSRTAQPFFRTFGFVIVEERSPVVRGVAVPNALMHKDLVE